ncbi:MAG: WD40 repeat domain-containing protein, partial [Myxococcota bacterium]
SELWRRTIPWPIQASFAPDGSRIALLGTDGQVQLLDTATGAMRALGTAERSYDLMPLEFSASGRWLATTGDEYSIKLWDLDNGSERVLRGHHNNVYTVDFNRDETLMLSAGDDATARVWDLSSKSVRVLSGHNDDLFMARFSPRGDLLATGSLDGTMRVWPVAQPSITHLGGHKHTPMFAAFASNDALLSIDENGEVRRWPLEHQRSDLLHTGAHKRIVSRRAISNNRRFVVSRSVDSESPAHLLVDLHTGERVALPMPDRVDRIWIAIADSGQLVATLSKKRGIELWTVTAKQPVKLNRKPGDFCDLALSPDGSQLAVVTPSHLELWATATGQRMAEITLPGDNEATCGEYRGIPRAVYASDGKYLAVSKIRSDIAVWDLVSMRTHVLPTDGSRVFYMAFSPDNAMFAATGIDRKVMRWDLSNYSGGLIGRHEDLIHDILFAPNSQLLATASFDRTVRLWEQDGRGVRILHGHDGAIMKLAFSPDGRTLASTSQDLSIRLWPVEAASACSDRQTLHAELALTTACIGEDNEVYTPTSGRLEE